MLVWHDVVCRVVEKCVPDRLANRLSLDLFRISKTVKLVTLNSKKFVTCRRLLFLIVLTVL